jgi:hypothetical protein
MVVGVGTLGSDVYALGDTGGAARVALESQHNGPHTHSFNQAGWGGSVLVAGGSFTSFYHTHFGATTGSSGLGTPHENRPAYLALLFCSLDVDEPGGDGGMNEPGVLGISPAEALYFLMCVGVIALYALGFVVGQQR